MYRMVYDMNCIFLVYVFVNDRPVGNIGPVGITHEKIPQLAKNAHIGITHDGLPTTVPNDVTIIILDGLDLLCAIRP